MTRTDATPMYRRRTAKGVAFLFTVIVMTQGGCSQLDLSHTKAKDDANERWKTTRAQVKLRLARDQLDAGRVDDALRHLHEAIELKPEIRGSKILLARIQLAKGELATARTTLDEASVETGSAVEAAYLRGALEERAGRWADALRAYWSAMKAEPNDLDHVVAVAETTLALGHADETLQWLATLDDHHGHTAEYHVLRGRALTLAGRHVDAADAYTTAHELVPNDAAIREALAWSLLWAGRYAAAESIFADLLDASSEESRLSIELAYGRCLLETGQANRAEQQLAKVTDSATESVALWQLRARAAWERNDVDGALQAARQAVALTPDDVQCQLMLAVFAFRLGDEESVRDLVPRILKAEPENALALRMQEQLHPMQTATTIDQTESPPGVQGTTVATVRPLIEASHRVLCDGLAATVRLLQRGKDRLARSAIPTPTSIDPPVTASTITE